MANLKTNNLCGEGGRRAYRGSVFLMVENQLQQHKLLLQKVMMTSHLELVILH